MKAIFIELYQSIINNGTWSLKITLLSGYDIAYPLRESCFLCYICYISARWKWATLINQLRGLRNDCAFTIFASLHAEYTWGTAEDIRCANYILQSCVAIWWARRHCSFVFGVPSSDGRGQHSRPVKAYKRKIKEICWPMAINGRRNLRCLVLTYQFGNGCHCWCPRRRRISKLLAVVEEH